MQHAEVTIKAYSDIQYRSIKQFRPELALWLDLSLQKATAADPRLGYQAFAEFFTDLSKPSSSAVEAYKKQPLLARNPLLFWQSVSTLLFIGLVVPLLN
jgi:hypothetical protein